MTLPTHFSLALSQREAAGTGAAHDHGTFVSVSPVMPESHPLARDLQWCIDHERGFGRLPDLGIIQPRFRRAVRVVRGRAGAPELPNLMQDGVVTYAWDPADAEPWDRAAGS